ncbi:MAG: 4Fe-4S dicluster domain-containing protein [Candidatus Methanolliviera sp. GoM_oil]|nr:MAG: 4Fe-4S dicluster domain-containing protein [Candidatus Methanolliviera sp. GoM_oil]
MGGGLTKSTEGSLCIIKRRVYFNVDEIIVDASKCNGCGICILSCPDDAMSLEEPLIKDGHLVKKPLVMIDENKCSFCAICPRACPFDAIIYKRNGEVVDPIEDDDFPNFSMEEKAFEGELTINDCYACVEICPCEALKKNDERRCTPDIDMEKCILCGACVNVCPEGRITIHRERIKYGDARSGTWFRALLNLTDEKIYTEEMHEISLNTAKKLI